MGFSLVCSSYGLVSISCATHENRQCKNFQWKTGSQRTLLDRRWGRHGTLLVRHQLSTKADGSKSDASPEQSSGPTMDDWAGVDEEEKRPVKAIKWPSNFAFGAAIVACGVVAYVLTSKLIENTRQKSIHKIKATYIQPAERMYMDEKPYSAPPGHHYRDEETAVEHTENFPDYNSKYMRGKEYQSETMRESTRQRYDDNNFEDDKMPLRTARGAAAMERLKDIQGDVLDEYNKRLGEEAYEQPRSNGEHEVYPQEYERQLEKRYRELYGWDGVSSDEEFSHGRTVQDMQDRAVKATQSALRASNHAHHASVAACIATEASKEAQAAAQRASQAAARAQLAFERRSMEEVKLMNAEALREEKRSEKEAEVSSKCSAKAVMEEKSAKKTAKVAVDCDEFHQSQGIIETLKDIKFAIGKRTKKHRERIAAAVEAVQSYVGRTTERFKSLTSNKS